MDGMKDEVWCPACGTRFSRGREGGRIRIQEASGDTWEVPTHLLTRVPEDPGALISGGKADDGSWSHQAAVEVSRATKEIPFYFRGELLGFAEVYGPSTPGHLAIDPEGLTFQPDDAAGGKAERWLLLDIRAVQTSSSSLQFAAKDRSLVQFRFHGDSPRRWENLLRAALKAIYRKHGLGEIVEFQPRIVTER
jgi:hypothetical protein